MRVCLYFLYVYRLGVTELPEKKVGSIPTRFSVKQIAEMDRLIKKLGLRSRSELIRDAVDHYLTEKGSLRIIELRDISLDEAKEEIIQYIKGKGETDAFDIANDLRLDLDLTTRALKELWEEGEVE